jgi:ubiquinone/menaquinone biosynthesis C-methylase UbiE
MFNLIQLNKLRKEELNLILPFFKHEKSNVLEFGAGNGYQAKVINDLGYNVIAIDIHTSDYLNNRFYDVINYDGNLIPIPDHSIDLIFSSNVLEHVENINLTLSEFHRVLKKNGYCIHIMPSVSWRIWTFITGPFNTIIAFGYLILNILKLNNDFSKKYLFKTIIASIIPIGHGTSSEGISEIFTFSENNWTNIFKKNNFEIINVYPIGIFHTGHMILGDLLSINNRKKISKILGSAAKIYILKVKI